jgi:hypothetical protein
MLKRRWVFRVHVYGNIDIREAMDYCKSLLMHGLMSDVSMFYLNFVSSKYRRQIATSWNSEYTFIPRMALLQSNIYFHRTIRHNDITRHLISFEHSLSRYDGLHEVRQTSKLQNKRALFDVELYLTVHKSFVSTSLNIIHCGCTFHLSYPYWTVIYENTISSITVHKIT